MRTKYLFAFSVAVAALFLPRAAQAQSCQGGTLCETYAVYDPISQTISGYSYYENRGCSAVLVESYIWDPNYNIAYLGGASGSPSAQVDFSYPPQLSGTFTIAGYNSYELEDYQWTPDGNSSTSTWGGPPPYISGCQLQGSSWVAGQDTIVCSGQFLTGSAFVSAGGPYGNGFLSSGNATVVSDTEIDVNVDLTEILYNGAWISISDGDASYLMDLPDDIEPPSTLTLRRQSLTQVAASGSPPNGTFQSGIYNNGYSGIAGLQVTDNHDGTALLTLSDPSNIKGAPTPGGLATVEAYYYSPNGLPSLLHSFTVPTFGMSCYRNSLETDFMNGSGQCSDGSQKVSAAGVTGIYCSAFLADVKVQGSGFSANGTAIQYNTDAGAYYFAPKNTPTGSDGPLKAGETVARDVTIIPRYSGWTVTVDGVANGSSLQATDSGGRITGYRLDLFLGPGKSACSSFANPMGVATCSPGGATCPGGAVQ